MLASETIIFLIFNLNLVDRVKSEKELNTNYFGDGRRLLFHSGRTIADVVLNERNDILRCSLRAAKDITKKNNMFRSLESFADTGEKSILDTALPFREMFTATKIIVKDTLWCGRNNIAKQYNQLGPDYQLDRCCRAHDFCPFDLPGLTKSNPAPYTMSACECDQVFYDCLKAVGSKSTEDVGKIFFNIAKVPCVNFVQQRRCSVRDKSSDSCLEWTEDTEKQPLLEIREKLKKY
ncbi:phospholipase A2 isoform X2 [Eurytemora carolleeae]|uniref:phospholipase A2 isoform X2 n=1 Tax=Eurytemora carolleeae TaxID=1294199 RepID=UPI000C765600|nr:phospholipase A2 isoform X2 [Eurytemora carolleeae]|eukprot:XP_023335173.1 phospholipase A2-like isoform X2 [Eurytemora affinis]